MTKKRSSEILGGCINFFPRRSFRHFALKMCSDECSLKHALTYSDIDLTFIVAALAACILFYNVSCRPIDKKPIYKPAMQTFKNFWGSRTQYPILFPITDTRAVFIVSLVGSILINIHEQ